MKDNISLEVNRFLGRSIYTFGRLRSWRDWKCYTLEDTVREKGYKIYGKTAIWEGTYTLTKIKYGRFYARYKKRFGHPYAIGIIGCPDFEELRMHIGNWVTDTEGCVLVGYTSDLEKGMLGKSALAYQQLWKEVDAGFRKGYDKIVINNSWLED